MGHSSRNNTPTPLVTWIASSQGEQPRILLSEDIRARGDLVVFNHFLIHGTPFANTVGSPTLKQIWMKQKLEPRATPPTSYLKTLWSFWVEPPWFHRQFEKHQSSCYTHDEKEAHADKISLDLALAHLTIHRTPYGLATVDFFPFSDHAMLSLLGLSIYSSLLETLSSPPHASLSSNSPPACPAPQ